LSRNAQKRDKKKIEQNNQGSQGRKKKNGGKKIRIFCDEPRWTFSKKVFFVFLNSPCYETPKKRPKKKSIKNKNKNKNKIK
jgi:hypothetical protein